MELIRWMIHKPVTVSVGVILLVLFGLVSLFGFPVQLTPDVERPIITVETTWPGAAPEEVEREIIDRQEDVLKGVTGLRKMTSESQDSRGTITLEFYVGVDKNTALRDVSDKLRQVEEYPEEANEPVVSSGEADVEAAIGWFLFYRTDHGDVSTYRDFLEDFIQPRIERVEGVASVNIFGGVEREVQVRVNAAALAAKGLTFTDLRRALQSENLNVAAGTLAEGKRDYSVRTVARYESIQQVLDTVVGYTAGGPVYVRDVADVVKAHKKQTMMVRSRGKPVIAMNVTKETGANVLETMRNLQKVIKDLNETVLKPRGLVLEQVYDQTEYIDAAIQLVLKNLLLGTLLAVAVLMLFLRSKSATITLAVSIPISVVGAFLVLALLGRTLNVISLAGIAFSVGMVVDGAIVVLENIYRHLQMGKKRFEAALDGAAEVWGAVLASTLTTVAVFVPVVFVQEEAGQLFRDIAIAIAAAVILSLLVAMSVIPTLSARILHANEQTQEGRSAGGSRGFKVPRWVQWLRPVQDIRQAGAACRAGMVAAVDWTLRSWPRRIAVAASLTVGSIWISIALMPPSSYLPTGNRNLVYSILFTPPGYNVQENGRIAAQVEAFLRPYWEAKPGTPEAEQLVNPMPGGPKPVPIKHFFFVAPGWGICFMGASSTDPQKVTPLKDVLNAAMFGLTDSFGVAQQAPLFMGRGGSGGNTVDLEIRSPDLDAVVHTAALLMGASIQALKQAAGDPNAVVFPRPSPPNFMLARPEWRFEPDRVKAAKCGYTAADVGFITRVCVDGADVGDFIDKGDRIDLTLKLKDAESLPTHMLGSIPIYVPADGTVCTLSNLCRIIQTDAPQQINHIERQRAVRLTLTPPRGVALQTAMEVLDRTIRQLRGKNEIPPSVDVWISGEADKLVQTRRALQNNFILAAIITYLLMAALFESFLYPFVIMFSVPLALVGGFVALGLLHRWTLMNPYVPVQQLDVLTMLGFVILIGIVVNNAILIVHQALNFLRAGRPQHEAIIESVRTRIRPIYMSALTSVFGMVPLVVMSGAGSELYRGLGAAVLGGLLVSTIFTVFLVPTVFAMFMDVRSALGRAALGLFGAERGAAEPAASPEPDKPAPTGD